MDIEPRVANGHGHAPAVGELLRGCRQQRRRSQLDLALQVGVSTRHLSFIENGRARPSAAMVIALADALQLPLRTRNRLLLAAGYAPRYSERALDAAEMAPVRQALQRLLDAHHPYPGLVLDRQWNVVLTNGAAAGMVAMLPDALRGPPLNLLRASLHPDGFAAMTANFDDWGAYLVETLQRQAANTGDTVLRELEREVLGYPNVRALLERQPPRDAAAALPLVPCVLRTPAGELAMFTTLTTFGSPRDITLDELCVEMFYPADAATEAVLRARA